VLRFHQAGSQAGDVILVPRDFRPVWTEQYRREIGNRQVKVFGGGNVTDTRNQIGTQNAEFVLRYLEDEGLSCSARDLGGPYPRRIQYFPSTGRVVRKLLTGGDRDLIVREESEYAKGLTTKTTAGEVQLFGVKSTKAAAGEVTLFGAKRK